MHMILYGICTRPAPVARCLLCVLPNIIYKFIININNNTHNTTATPQKEKDAKKLGCVCVVCSRPASHIERTQQR